jgi:hypothetical protein
LDTGSGGLMFRKALVALALCLTLTGCGKYTFEDVYRYPCQDPANWESPDCQPPNCEAFGICTKDVMKGTPLYDEDSEYENAPSTEGTTSDE